MNKQYLRKIYKEKRSALSLAMRGKMDDLLLIRFQQLEIDIPALIMTYSPVDKLKEFDPQLVIDYCYFKNPGQQLFYPVMVNKADGHGLTAVAVDDETVFETNKYGIDEPVNGRDMPQTAIDLVIVPLLSFDTNGNRVGYGKGYYDRFLKDCREDCIKIGFSYFEPVEKIEDADRFDIRLDYGITPDTIYQF